VDINIGPPNHHLKHFQLHPMTASCVTWDNLLFTTPGIHPCHLPAFRRFTFLITYYESTRHFFFGVWRIFVYVIPDISHLPRLKPLFLSLPCPGAHRHAVKEDWSQYLTQWRGEYGARIATHISCSDTCEGQSFGARMNQDIHNPNYQSAFDVSVHSYFAEIIGSRQPHIETSLWWAAIAQSQVRVPSNFREDPPLLSTRISRNGPASRAKILRCAAYHLRYMGRSSPPEATHSI
jgi:hypothetical protein